MSVVSVAQLVEARPAAWRDAAGGWRALAAALVARADAAAHGITVVRLGTHRVLTEAIALYRSSGYHEIAPYDASPYNQLAFEKPL